MKVKYAKRTSVIRNAIFLVLLSSYFLFILKSLESGTSALRPVLFLEFAIANKFFIGLSIITVLLQYFGNTLSKIFYWVTAGYVLANGLVIFAATFDKPILILTSFYLVLTYFTFLLWNRELKEAAYQPNYFENSIYKKSHHQLPTVLNSPSGRWEGYLTNWDEEGCFFYSDEGVKGSGTVELNMEYEDIAFKCNGKIITRYGKGVGIKVLRSAQNDQPGWNDFYDIISSRGF